MIDKLKLCVSTAELLTDKVVAGDAIIHNLQSDSGSGTICFIGLPKAKKRMNVEITESSTITVAIMKRSVLDKDISEEFNILDECELLMNKFLSHIRCKSEFHNVTADLTIKLKETDNLLSGIEALISFEPL